MAEQGKDKQYYIDKYGAEAQAAWEKSDTYASATSIRIMDWATEMGMTHGTDMSDVPPAGVPGVSKEAGSGSDSQL